MLASVGAPPLTDIPAYVLLERVTSWIEGEHRFTKIPPAVVEPA
jgi:hypothetical protein